MEKYGVVKAGITPEERADKTTTEKQSAESLDADFRKRAAEAAKNATSN